MINNVSGRQFFKLSKFISFLGNKEIMPCFCKAVKFPFSKD